MIKAKEYLQGINVDHGKDHDYDDVMKAVEIAYLEGVLKYTTWSDSIPNGDSICDEYENRLKELLDE